MPAYKHQYEKQEFWGKDWRHNTSGRMSAIKKFFQKKKLDRKFKKAGEGHKLTDDTRSDHHVTQIDATQHQPRSGMTNEQRRAAEAAMMRNSTKNQAQTEASMLAKVRMRRELEEERKAEEEAMKMAAHYREGPKEVVKESAPVLSHVLYTCPDISPMVSSKAEIEVQIEEFLLGQLADEPGMASSLMIQTLNKDKEKVKVCVDTLSKYLDNLISNPSEEKFRKIRLGNKAFKERVGPLKGTDEFLQAVGFKLSKLPFKENEVDFYVIEEKEAGRKEHLETMKEYLNTAEPIKPQLDRAMKLFHPSPLVSKFDIPAEFYNISPEELKREQQRRQEATEKLGMLRTKAMRERDEQRELRKYRFVLIRVKFPEGIILQGTFKAVDKLSNLFEFVRENMANDWMPFDLVSGGQKLTEQDMTLAELGLAPAAVVNFTFDKTILADIAAQQGPSQNNVLKPEVMAQIQDL
ncbi:hypothetical protein FSP39_012651 [Pinctada imbricata]|uniref:UBX domain-containing protein n=1 Tax=Pinctada imbricata TaxID=66713 RepID=A0AA89C6C3_PINIB|nr:hypothetical protein FSP39_012651 [Pinctada imbricata]